MAGDVVRLVVAVALLALGAELLIRGAASLARRLGLTPLVIGLTVVAFGTSAPEMVVSVGGAARGQGDIALGNVVGSNIFNVGVILALAALVAPIRVKLGLLKLDAPLVVAVSLLVAWMAHAGTVSRGLGVVLLALLVAYTVFSLRLARRQAGAEVAGEFEAAVPRATAAWVSVLLVVAGLGVLVFGSQLLVGATMAIARALGVGEAVLGLTVVAAGTSMPELATSVVAAARGQSDIAVGNVIGSNLFNLLGILGLAATVRPLSAPGIAPFDLWVMVAFAAGLVPLLWTGRTLQRGEALLLLAGYGAYLWRLWP